MPTYLTVCTTTLHIPTVPIKASWLLHIRNFERHQFFERSNQDFECRRSAPKILEAKTPALISRVTIAGFPPESYLLRNRV